MKVKDIIKKQTTLIAIAVAGVVIAALSVSYAIFFDVKKSADQVITAGKLKLTISNINTLNLDEVLTTTKGLESTPANYTIENTETLPASYKLYVYVNSDSTISADKIKISTDGDGTSGTTATVLSSITDVLNENGTTYYQIKSDTLASGATSPTQYIRVWVDEDLLSNELENAKVSLSLYIVSEVDES